MKKALQSDKLLAVATCRQVQLSIILPGVNGQIKIQHSTTCKTGNFVYSDEFDRRALKHLEQYFSDSCGYLKTLPEELAALSQKYGYDLRVDKTVGA